MFTFQIVFHQTVNIQLKALNKYDNLTLFPYFCRNLQHRMKQHNIRITLSVLLSVAAFIFIAQLLLHEFDKDQQFFLIVQSLLFIYLASINYSDRFTPLLGRKQTHYAIIVILAIVLSFNNYLLVTKEGPDAVRMSALAQYFNS